MKRRFDQRSPSARCLFALLCIATLGLTTVSCASEAQRGTGSPAEVQDEGPSVPEPRYQPREPVEKSWYDDSYLFGMTRAVTNSTIHPAAQVPLLVLTIPLDIAFLPIAAIGGMF